MIGRTEYTGQEPEVQDQEMKIDQIRAAGDTLSFLINEVVNLRDEQKEMQAKLIELTNQWKQNLADGQSPSAENMIQLVQAEGLMYSLMKEMEASLQDYIANHKKLRGAVEQINAVPQERSGNIIN
ncbi:MAG: hypothetical protein WCG48_01240 [Candidatus Berkelbacteria bacterium]